MLKIDYCSDLHLEFGGVELPGGDVLILAGDVVEVTTLEKAYKSASNSTKPYFDFFECECQKYEKVLYVLGNHEHYNYRLDKSFVTLRDLLPSNVTVLENSGVTIDGVLYLGGTMWTDMGRGSDLAMYNAKQVMNDYRKITYKRGTGYGKLNPKDTVAMHTKTVKYFIEQLEANPNTPTVIITHHAPSWQSVPQEYVGDLLSAAYVSDLTDIMLDHPQLTHWIHGHIHDPQDYMVGTTRILANPRGYKGYESIANHFQVRQLPLGQ